MVTKSKTTAYKNYSISFCNIAVKSGIWFTGKPCRSVLPASWVRLAATKLAPLITFDEEGITGYPRRMKYNISQRVD